MKDEGGGKGGGGWIGKPRPVKPAGLPPCYYADVDVPSNQNYAMLTTPGPCSTLPRAIQSFTTVLQSHQIIESSELIFTSRFTAL